MKHRFTQPQPSTKGLVSHIQMYYGFTDGASTLYDYSGSGFLGTAINSPEPKYPGFEFTNASTNYIDIGTGPTVVKTVSLWVKPDNLSVTRTLISLNGTDILLLVNATLSKGGFADGGAVVLYTNAVAAAVTLTTSWNHVAITDADGQDALDLDIGKLAGVYFDGLIADVRLYSSVLSVEEIKSLYEVTRWRYGV